MRKLERVATFRDQKCHGQTEVRKRTIDMIVGRETVIVGDARSAAATPV